jgi:hypothetical protein
MDIYTVIRTVDNRVKGNLIIVEEATNGSQYDVWEYKSMAYCSKLGEKYYNLPSWVTIE